MKELFSRVVSMRRRTQAERRLSYGELVERLAGGEEPEQDEVNAVLDAAGVDVEQLVADAERKTQRIADAALLETEPEALDELRALRAEKEQLEAERREKIEQLQARYADKLTAVHERIDANEQRRKAIGAARQRLVKGADEDLHKRLTAVKHEINSLTEYADFPDGDFPEVQAGIVSDHGLLGRLRTVRARHLAAAAESREKAESVRGSTSKEKRSEYAEDAAMHERKAERLAEQIDTQKNRLAELVAERAKIEARLVEVG